MDIAVQKTAYMVEDRSWLASAHGTEATRSVTLDLTLFDPTTHYPNGYLPSGLVLGLDDSGLYGPYSGTTDEKQTVTVTGGPTGGTFTLTYSGQTTAAIAYNATAATVQAALVALSNVSDGDVVVTGDAGGPYTVLFAGALADTDVAQMTASGAGLTGGTTPSVTVATTTTGGADGSSDGRQVAAGLLFNSIDVSSGSTKFGAPLMEHGFVLASMLPAGNGLDANAKTDLKLIIFR